MYSGKLPTDCLQATEKKKPHYQIDSGVSFVLAEREGFEPSVMLPPRLISSQVHSTTLPPLRIVESAIVAGFLGPHEKFTLKYAEIYATKRSKPPM